MIDWKAVDDGVDRALRRLASREVSKKLGPASLCECKKTAWAANGPWAAIVDANRLPVLDMGWSVSMRGDDPACLMKRVGAETWRIHRLMIHVPPRCVVDHVNGNPLDNRLSNLRVASVAENNRNRRARRGLSRYRGVHAHPSGKWLAVIRADGVKHSLGLHPTPEAAALAYDRAARKLHGDFAKLNFEPPTSSV